MEAEAPFHEMKIIYTSLWGTKYKEHLYISFPSRWLLAFHKLKVLQGRTYFLFLCFSFKNTGEMYQEALQPHLYTNIYGKKSSRIFHSLQTSQQGMRGIMWGLLYNLNQFASAEQFSSERTAHIQFNSIIILSNAEPEQPNKTKPISKAQNGQHHLSLEGLSRRICSL